MTSEFLDGVTSSPLFLSNIIQQQFGEQSLSDTTPYQTFLVLGSFRKQVSFDIKLSANKETILKDFFFFNCLKDR